MKKQHTFNCSEYIMSSPSSLYDRLGVGKSASTDEIKKAYRDMARQHHPDKGGDTETFKSIQEAYEVLSDQSRKQMYDMTGSTSEQRRQQQQPFPDIFSMFAGMRSSHQQQQTKVRRERGPDTGTEVVLGLDAFYNGLEINMNFKQKRKCEACRSDTETCTDCGGSGMYVVVRQMGPMSFQSQELCPACQGTGKKYKTMCKACRNERFTQREKTLTARLVPGMSAGETITFPGECCESSDYDTPGDVVVMLRAAPSRYEWKGSDLHLTHTISFADSILGFEVTLDDHPSRKQQVFRWAGGPIIHGTVLAMEGKGMPRKNGGGYGDVKIKLNVKPPSLVPWTSEQRKALESIFRGSG